MGIERGSPNAALELFYHTDGVESVLSAHTCAVRSEAILHNPESRPAVLGSECQPNAQGAHRAHVRPAKAHRLSRYFGGVGNRQQPKPSIKSSMRFLRNVGHQAPMAPIDHEAGPPAKRNRPICTDPQWAAFKRMVSTRVSIAAVFFSARYCAEGRRRPSGKSPAETVVAHHGIGSVNMAISEERAKEIAALCRRCHSRAWSTMA